MKTKVIKVTRWYLNPGKRDPVLKKGQYVYGLLTHASTWDVLLTPPHGCEFLEVVCSLGGGQDTIGWAINPDEDKFSVIPEDQWPDEVYVALAKRALLGEDDDDGDSE